MQVVLVAHGDEAVGGEVGVGGLLGELDKAFDYVGVVLPDAPGVAEVLVAMGLGADEGGNGGDAAVGCADGVGVHLVAEDGVGVGIDASR